MFNKIPPSNRSSYAIEFKTDKNGDMLIIGNKDTFMALSLILDRVIEDEASFSTKFRRRTQLHKDIIVTIDYKEDI